MKNRKRNEAPGTPPDVNSLSYPVTDLKPGAKCSGFVIIDVKPFAPLNCQVIQARHLHSGAQLIHLLADDDENLFAIAFRTPPSDDSGIPHILEHSVLGGSQKYPVKDPFVEMLKSSMATFINAMTYPDKTVYPVASNVKKDFFNLVDVYCDAVLHPNITEMTLKQEGHHLAFADPGSPDGPLTIRGIVYNEMKGAYSDLDSLIDRAATQMLFPDSPYGCDSGGDPDQIPNLTYSRFRAFFDQFYHPANSRIFLYGNIPTAEHLAFLDERLATVKPPPDEIRSQIIRQPRWSAPQLHTTRYPIDPDSKTDSGRTAMTMNWITGDLADPISDLAMEVVDRLLLGSAAAPLRKALVDSQLGADLTSAGYNNSTLETSFHVGLKGMAADCEHEQLEQLVLSVLQKVVSNGFADDKVQIAFNQMQYTHREIQSHYPLRLMDWVYNAWLYDLDPLMYLKTGECLEELQEMYRRDHGIFGRLIQERLLDNPHRITLVFEPDPELEQQRAEVLASDLASRKEQMDAAELTALLQEAKALDQLQTTPNSPEAITRLPQLALTDLPAIPRAIPCSVTELSRKVPFLQTDVPTNGITYLMLAFDLAALEADLLPYIPLFCRLFTRMGAGEMDYTAVAEEIAGHTGGLGASDFIGSDVLDQSLLLDFITISMKTLDHSTDRALALIRKLLFEWNLSDRKHLRDVLKQTRERCLSSILPNGHHLVKCHSARSLSRAAGLADLWGGPAQIRLVDQISRADDVELDDLCQRLQRIRRFLLNANRLKVSFSGNDGQAQRIQGWLCELLAALSQDKIETAQTPLPGPGHHGWREGLSFMADVAYCATSFPAPHISDPRSAPLQALAHLLSFDYLWEEVRVKGGAYGGICNYDPAQGFLALMSYRDPNIARTLEVYAQVENFIRDKRWTQHEVERAVIGCAKHEERPLRPAWATATALWRYLARLSEDLRMDRRQNLLKCTPDSIRQTALELLAENREKANTCVLSSREKLARANDSLTPPLELENLLN